MPFGEGLTSQIIESGEPLLLNSATSRRPAASVGTPSKSYLGVPIWAGDQAIGVISVQSTREEGRYGEADARLLATLAANVGVAIQNARLFAEIARQKQYFESLVGISPVAVIEMDADERVTGWNPAADGALRLLRRRRRSAARSTTSSSTRSTARRAARSRRRRSRADGRTASRAGGGRTARRSTSS